MQVLWFRLGRQLHDTANQRTHTEVMRWQHIYRETNVQTSWLCAVTLLPAPCTAPRLLVDVARSRSESAQQDSALIDQHQTVSSAHMAAHCLQYESRIAHLVRRRSWLRRIDLAVCAGVRGRDATCKHDSFSTSHRQDRLIATTQMVASHSYLLL